MTSPVALTTVRVECDGLTLRSPRDDDIDPLMAVYDDSFNLGRRVATERSCVQDCIRDERIEGSRHPTNRTKWCLELVVESEPGTVLGWASLYPQNDTDWDVLETSSWIELGQRGRHHSRTIRRALLALAFDGLGARLAVSRAQTDSYSNATSEHLGYRKTSTYPDRDGYWYWALFKAEWDATKPTGIEICGYQPFLDWLQQA